ncbi:MAG: sulfur carrier protein ThiS adenylyltransferase ThiF [Fervidobacterium sp.]
MNFEIKNNNKIENSFEDISKQFSRMLSFYFSNEMLKKLEKARVIIIGCGGLGSNIASILVRSGIKYITLVDYDTVDLSNLNRQNYNIEDLGKMKTDALKENLIKINKEICVNVLNLKVDDLNIEEILSTHNIVVEAVDNERTKSLIFNKACELGKYIVSASGVAGFGNCEEIKIKRGRNFSIVGDFKTSIKDEKPLASKVCAIASIQADEILRLVRDDELHLFK